MNKKLKIVLALCLTFSMAMVSLHAVMASHLHESHQLEDNDLEVSELFIDYINDVFINQNKVTIIDNSGNDITNTFFEFNQLFFEKKDYSQLKQYINDNVDYICIDEGYSNENAKSPFVKQSVNERYYQIVKKNGAAGEIVFYIKGWFIWDRATNKITDHSSATIELSTYSFGANWRVTSSSATTGVTVANNKYSITFRAYFNLNAKFYMLGEVIKDVDLGTFGDTFTKYPSDYE